MRKMLIVEDHDAKASAIAGVVSEAIADVEISRARSYQSGVKAIVEERFDLVLLDMTMPTFDEGKNESGGKPQPFAGKYVLDQIDRFGLDLKVLVVTQFETFGVGREFIDIDSLDEQLKKAYQKNYLGKIYYHAAQSVWKKELTKKLGEIWGGSFDD